MNHLTRRNLLKSAAATIALPWLESLNAATAETHFNRTGQSPKRDESPKRIAFMYIPNGVISEKWFPQSKSEMDFDFPESIKPLEKLRENLTVISGLNRTYLAGEPHAQAASCWLTSAMPNQFEDGSTAINMTLDQMIAKVTGEETPFRSIELSCNSFENNLEPKNYDAISWYGPGNDARSENNPQRVFKRIFGKSQLVKGSVLDAVLGQASELRKNLAKNDQKKLDEYLESVRSIEARIEKQKQKRVKVEMDMPEGVPSDRGEYIRMMGDLMILALRTDQTRVATMMVGPERWSTPQLFDGVFDKPVNHHEMTHDKKFDNEVAQIDRFHVEQYAYLVEKMASHQEGENTLLDNTFFVLGSGLGEGDSHSYQKLPVIIAGKGGENIKNGRHITCAEGTPIANLWLTLAQKMNVPIKEFADSKKTLSEYI